MLQMCCWELAKNPDIQSKLCQEIDGVLKELKGEPISYEKLNEMKLLDLVIMETVRKWPSFGFMDRICTKNYTYKNEDNGQIYNFMKGDNIQVPIHTIQYDPKYFPEPLTFNPYRFSDENKHKIVAGSYVGFGYGPRACMGMRLAQLDGKLAIFKILSKYSILCCEETPEKVNYALSGMGMKSIVFVELKPRAN